MNARTVTLLLALTCCLGWVQAVVRPGQCPQATVVRDFNTTAYLGVWYEIQRYEADFQVSLDCTTAEYTQADPSVARLTVVNSGILFNGTSGTAFEVRGVAVPSFPEDSSNPGKFSVAFFGAEPDRSNYWVLDTDYTNYSVVWSCEQISAQSYNEFAWVLSRSKEVTSESYAKIYSAICANNVQVGDFRFTDQSIRCYLDISPF